MSEVDINEPVAVWAFFDPSTRSINSGRANSGQVRFSPIAMSWNKQLVKFKKTIFTTSKMVGGIKLINLVCASETANFELEFDSSSFLWKLKKVMPQ